MDWLNSVTEQKILFWITLKNLLSSNLNQAPIEESINFLIKIEEQKKKFVFLSIDKNKSLFKNIS